MRERIGIVGMGSCSALGSDRQTIWEAYQRQDTALAWSEQRDGWHGAVSSQVEADLSSLRQSNRLYQRVDRSVLLAILAAQRMVEQYQGTIPAETGLQLGSSRGATGLWETAYDQHTSEQALSPSTSPLTTQGQLASLTAQYLGLQGWVMDSSITCSTALHALATAVAWLESGRYEHFIVGGAEAPLTAFTLAQIQSLKITSKASKDTNYPCRSLDVGKIHNSMVLGEGSALFALQRNPQKPLAWLRGIGWARENTKSLTAVSTEGKALQTAMYQALADAALTTVDAIICHCPGTVLGDKSEMAAIQAVFGQNMPSLTSNKWKLGHTLGASGGLSLEMAVLMLQEQVFLPIPYLNTEPPEQLNTVMVNALGFGGNAISVIIER